MVTLSHPESPVPEAGGGPVTIGIDVGTTSVKAVAVDAAGAVIGRVRRPHALVTTGPERLEHDAAAAWHAGPRAVLAELTELAAGAGTDVAAVAVSAMVPSMTAVDGDGRPVAPGLLYGDERGRPAGSPVSADPTRSPETANLVRWLAGTAPRAAGFWPAQAVANRALGGPGVVDYTTAFSAGPLFDGSAWSPADAGLDPDTAARLPAVAMFGEAVGGLAGGGLLGAGGVDAFCEQMVAGTLDEGDVLVVCGSTLVVWATVAGWPEVDGLWTLPHLAPGRALLGGATNAGGLFLDWVDRVVASGPPAANPGTIPVWWPYIRGERVPLHDPGRRAGLAGVDLTQGPAELRRAAHEASAFAVRHILERAGVAPRRLVATGGGCRSAGWMQALADGTGAPVAVAAVPEGAALGAAWLARMAAGLESSIEGAGRWARVGRTVVPRPDWAEAMDARWVRYRAGVDDGCGPGTGVGGRA